MSITERMAAIHIDSAAANNRGDGATAGTAWRDAEELTRRLGRGTAWFRQPTTITYHGNTIDPDAARFDAVIGNNSNLTLQGVASVVASGTLTNFTAFNRTPGSEALNLVEATGLSGGFAAHAGRYMRISGGARAGNGWWIHESFGTSASISTPGTIPFPFISTGFTRATPQAGDPFEIVTYPVVHCADWRFGSGDNQVVFGGAGFNQVNVQDIELDFGGENTGLQHDTGSAISSTVTGVFFRRCNIWTPSIFAGSGFTQFYQCNFRGNTVVLSGLLVRFVACRHKDNTASLAVRGGSNAVLDFDDLFDASAIFCVDRGSVVVGTACIFNRGADRVVLIDPGCQVWLTQVSTEIPALWGTNNPTHGVTVGAGARLIVDAGSSVTVNKTLGAGREMLVGGQDVLYSQINGSITNNGATVAFL